jgi:hypothetical protein
MPDKYCHTRRHKLTGDNVLPHPDGYPRCRACFNEGRKLQRHAKQLVEVSEPQTTVRDMSNRVIVEQIRTAQDTGRMLELRIAALTVEVNNAEKVCERRKARVAKLQAQQNEVKNKRALLEAAKQQRILSITAVAKSELGKSQEEAESFAAKQFGN